MTDSTRASLDETRTKSVFRLALLVWPVTTGLALMLLVLATFVTAGLKDISFSDAHQMVARQFNSTGDPFTFDAGFAFAGITFIITIAIGLAFSLPNGKVDQLPEINQRLISIIVVASILFAAAISSITIWNLFAGFASANTALVLVAAWLSTLVLKLVRLERPLEVLRRDAVKDWKALVAATPSNLGIYVTPSGNSSKVRFDPTPDRKQVRVARLQFWSLPLILALLPIIALTYDYQGFDIPKEPISFALFTPYSVLIMQFGCSIRFEQPLRSFESLIGLWFALIFGSLFLFLAIAAAFVAKSYALFIITLLIAIVLILLFSNVLTKKSFWFIRTLRQNGMIRQLTQAHEHLKKLEAECSDQEPEEPQNSHHSASQPLFRIEVFPRKRMRK